MGLGEPTGKHETFQPEKRDFSPVFVEAAGILARFGHARPGEDVEELFKTDVSHGMTDSAQLADLCERVERAKNGEKMQHGDFIDAVRYGLRNLACSRSGDALIFSGAIRNFDLRDSDLRFSVLRGADFSGTDFRGARLDVTNFNGSMLHAADLSSISILGEGINLREDEISIKESSVWTLGPSHDGIGKCLHAESRYLRVLQDPPEVNASSRRKGVLLFQEQKPIGLLKLEVERNFLALRTVSDKSGQVIFWKGMIYALDEYLRNFLDARSAQFIVPSRWPRADIEKIFEMGIRGPHRETAFGRNNMRFLADASLYSTMTELVQSIEAGKEPMVDILAE